jgi:hypothetical protein
VYRSRSTSSPHGGVEEPDRTVHLPNEHALNVLGLSEAFASSPAARLPGDLTVRVPTVAGPALLELVARSDRHLLHRPDAVDLDEIMTWYAEGPLLDDLYDRATGALGHPRFQQARYPHRWVAEAGVSLPVAGLYPSLHLNLSECHRKLGDLDRARKHLHAAQATIGALGDDEYGRLIRQGLEQVAEQLR